MFSVYMASPLMGSHTMALSLPHRSGRRSVACSELQSAFPLVIILRPMGVRYQRTPAHQYEPRQAVWLSTKTILLQVESRKLSDRFVGPLPILEVINQVVTPSFHDLLFLPFSLSLKLNLTFPVRYIPPAIEPALFLIAARHLLNCVSSSRSRLWLLSLKLQSLRCSSSFMVQPPLRGHPLYIFLLLINQIDCDSAFGSIFPHRP